MKSKRHSRSVSGRRPAARANPSASAGQAMVEFVVALIVMVVLLAGLVQIGQLAAAHTRVMTSARDRAAQAAMSDIYSLPLGAGYIYTWLPGPDGKPYTQDDQPFAATNVFDETFRILNMARVNDLTHYVSNNPISMEGMSLDPIDEFFLVRGTARESCPTLPAIRHLIYNRDSIEVKSEVWMAWSEGIY